jgi:hypothetical protein
MKIMMYIPVWMTVYCDVFCVEVCLGFVHQKQNTEHQHHKKGHQEQVEIRFWTGILGDVLENNILPKDQVLKNTTLSKGTVNVMIL